MFPYVILIVLIISSIQLAYASEDDDRKLEDYSSLAVLSDPFNLKLVISSSDSRGPITPYQTRTSIEQDIWEKIELGNTLIEDTAMEIATEYPGEYNINQVCEIYNTLTSGGWHYYSDPTSTERFNYANRSLQLGKQADTIGSGDCDDFAILMSSLIESIGGTTRVNLAFAPDGSGHAYTEVYLGKEGRVDELLDWLKNEYNKDEIPGINVSEEDVWLNLDWSSDDPYPGRPYFEGQKVVSIIRDAEMNASPKIVPVIDAMDSFEEWQILNDSKGSLISIKPTIGKKGNGLEIAYDLKDNGWVGISRDIAPKMLAGIVGLEFSNYGIVGATNTIELRMVYDDNTTFGVSWNKATVTDGWSIHKAPFSDFSCLGPESRCEACRNKLVPSNVSKIEFIISNNPVKGDLSGSGTIIIDQVQGNMAVPTGSPWARAEAETELALARELALQSEQWRDNPSRLIECVKLAVESKSHYWTYEGDQALTKGLALLALPLARMKHNDSVVSITFSPDGNKIATASLDGTARLWNTSSGQELFKLAHDGPVNYVAFNPDGTLIATASRDNSARIWDASSGRELFRFMHNDNVNYITFSPDGSKVATASSDTTAKVWDVVTGQTFFEVPHEWIVRWVTFSPDGTRIATASWDYTARIWSAENGDMLAEIKHDLSVDKVAFSPDGSKLLTACLDNAVRIWDTETGEQLALMKHDFAITSFAFSKDAKYIATVSADRILKVWSAETGLLLKTIPHNYDLWYVSFSPDGTKLAIGSRNMALIWDFETGELKKFMKHDAPVLSISFNSDGTKVATASEDKTAMIWSITDGLLTKIELESFVRSAVFSPDGKRVAAGGIDYRARIWDLESFKELTTVEHDGVVWSVNFSPDGTKLATASWDNTSRVWDSKSGQNILILKHDAQVLSSVFNPNGTKLATASNDNTARIWDASTGEQLLRIDLNDTVWSVAFSPTDNILATACNDGTARIYNVETFQEKEVFRHNSIVWSISFSPDGKKLATASGGVVWIWDMETSKLIKCLLGHSDSIFYLAFSPDGTKLATASADRTSRIWDIESGDQLEVMHHGDKVWSAHFSPDGTMLTTACDDKAVRVWSIWPEGLICEACSRLGCDLTSQEWQKEFCSECKVSPISELSVSKIDPDPSQDYRERLRISTQRNLVKPC